MKPLHKLNFLANTYNPKYETTSSLILSLLCYLITVSFTVYTCYSDIVWRKVSNIAYMGLHKNEKEYLNESLKIDIDFNIPFYCNYFYVTSENSKKVYLEFNNSSIKQTINLINKNSDGNYFYLKLYSNCRVDTIRSYYQDISYNVTFTYDIYRADYLNLNDPFTKENITQSYFVTLGDKNEKQQSDFDNYKSLKMNEFRFDYVYYRILDDLNWIDSNYNKEHYVHNLDRIIRTESYKSPPTEMRENLLFFKFTVDHNDSEVLLVKRRFIKIPEISSKILGVFSLVKLISKIFLKFAYYHSNSIHLINSIFRIKEFKSDKFNESYLLNTGSKNIVDELGRSTINSNNIMKHEKKYNYSHNLRFCCICKTKKMKFEYNMIKLVISKLKESTRLPNLIFSLFLLKNNYNYCYQPKLKVNYENENFIMEYKKFDETKKINLHMNNKD